MGSMILDFAEQLYSFMGLKYEVVSLTNAAEGGPPIEEYSWPDDELFTVDIARAVMMLSYAYRPSYRRHFKTVASLICTRRDNPRLYAVIFAKQTYRFHSPLRLLTLCSFISEMYLFIFYRKGAENGSRHYISPAMECFNNIYKAVLSKVDDPVLKWDDVKQSASLIAKGYESYELVMLTEHPSSESKDFFSSVQDVLQGSSQEGAAEGYGSSAANAPSTSAAYNQALADKRRQERLLEADALADQLARTSLTKQDSPSGDEKPKSRRSRKSSARPHKTRACGKSAESTSQAVASTSTAGPLDFKHYLASMGRNTTPHEDTNKPVAMNPAFRDVIVASQRVPGVGEEVRLYQARNNEATNESTNNSDDTMAVETRSDSSSVAKKKSKKNKKKKKGKK